jgi:hypothetical protein
MRRTVPWLVSGRRHPVIDIPVASLATAGHNVALKQRHAEPAIGLKMQLLLRVLIPTKKRACVGECCMHFTLSCRRNPGAAAQVALVTDRKLYRVGDVVYVKGYGRGRSASGAAPQALTGRGSVAVGWSDTETETKEVEFDSGMLHQSVEVPVLHEALRS